MDIKTSAFLISIDYKWNKGKVLLLVSVQGSGDSSNEHSESLRLLGSVLDIAQCLILCEAVYFLSSTICLARMVSFFLMAIRSLSFRVVINSISSFFFRLIKAIFISKWVILFFKVRLWRSVSTSKLSRDVSLWLEDSLILCLKCSISLCFDSSIAYPVFWESWKI